MKLLQFVLAPLEVLLSPAMLLLLIGGAGFFAWASLQERDVDRTAALSRR